MFLKIVTRPSIRKSLMIQKFSQYFLSCQLEIPKDDVKTCVTLKMFLKSYDGHKMLRMWNFLFEKLKINGSFNKTFI